MKKELLARMMEQYEYLRKRRRVFRAWQIYTQKRKRAQKKNEFCYAFYLQGLIMRSFKSMKLFAQVAGNRQYQKRTMERINIQIHTQLEEKKNEKEFLVAMIKELEEKYRIELRKKAIMKSQCDQAYLRGVSAISMEALKMSHSTLQDYYHGMKMPTYDGNNIYQ